MSETVALPTEVRVREGEVAVNVDELLVKLEHEPMSELEGELAVRALLLSVRRDRDEAERIRRLRDAVLSPYEMALESLSRREARIRNVLDVFLKRRGRKVSIPDAGCAYETTKNRGGRLRITDVDAFERELLGTLVADERERQELYRSQLDRNRALAVLEQHYATTADGQIVNRHTGEFVAEGLAGVDVDPEVREVALRLV